MVNKAPKPQKAPKAKRAGKTQNQSQNPFISGFPEGSLFAQSQKFVQEHDAKPFRDFSYFVLAFLTFFIWKLHGSVKADHTNGVGIWGLMVFGIIAAINVWTYFLVMICAKRRGDIGIVRIQDEDIIRSMWMSGFFGAWAAIFYFGYRPEDPNFYPKAISSSVLNVFWVAVAVKFYM
ncbi:hypothetical protein BGW38_003261 [Lunasporangiospora selenospora]|uniref:Uncharacterized protein n=1 Tax=Lunasporangiospora selenospora TaxID=979761 RepID=A0A9P6KCB9_9FUNG|nr:hypothetical protein BGW38_003261 [Lunasporangiospora selenospora]